MDFSIRAATLADAAILIDHRRAMFHDIGHHDEAALHAMSDAFLPWLTAKMEAGEYFAWLALNSSGEVVAGAGLWLMDWPPHIMGGPSRRGNIVNVYTRPDCRRQGLAGRLIETALECARAHRLLAVILHASQEGRDLYLSLGFKPTDEMRLILE